LPTFFFCVTAYPEHSPSASQENSYMYTHSWLSPAVARGTHKGKLVCCSRWCRHGLFWCAVAWDCFDRCRRGNIFPATSSHSTVKKSLQLWLHIAISDVAPNIKVIVLSTFISVTSTVLCHTKTESGYFLLFSVLHCYWDWSLFMGQSSAGKPKKNPYFNRCWKKEGGIGWAS